MTEPNAMTSLHPEPTRARSVRLAAAFVLTLAAPLPAAAMLEGDFERGAGPALTTWYGPVDPAAMRADAGYIAGMRPHHAGALTMSQDYLADPASSSPLLRQLARAIIVNQQFEVLLLDEVAGNLSRPAVSLPFGIKVQPMATEGVAQARLFRREPIPGFASGYAMGPVTERDVQFAKAMTIHHQGALDMARGYHANPDARNGFLGLFNVDVITDQASEIALMGRVAAAYPGDADAVRVDPSMIHGMEGMAGHKAHGAKPAADPHAGHGGAAVAQGGAQGGAQGVAQGQAAPPATAPNQTRRPPEATEGRPAQQQRLTPAKPAAQAPAGHEDHSQHKH